MDERISWEDLYRYMEDLKALARRLLMMERNASLQTMGLVATALRRLHRQGQAWDTMTWADRHELCRLATVAMKHALIDHARRRQRRARREVLQAPEVLAAVVTLPTLLDKAPPLVGALGKALERLAHDRPDWEALVAYRFLLGLSVRETAQVMEVDETTIKRRWNRIRPVLAAMILEYHNEAEPLGDASHDDPDGQPT
jgi:DNA-directed RNA polymerase specialized sigma24 family protein